MIVYELEDSFCLITQIDHAQLSGQLFDYLDKDFISDIDNASLRKAVFEHDRGWATLDDTPIWNDQQNRPYSFLDFPLAIKLMGYREGIQQVETEDPYAGLLCSMHYTDVVKYAAHDLITEFVKEETQRQQRIQEQVPLANLSNLLHHFHILQFLDRLSLFLCFREKGVSTLKEFPWYDQGFASSNQFTPNQERIQAWWTDSYELTMTPFLLRENIEIQVRVKYVQKSHLQQLGLAQAYQDSYFQPKTIFIKR